jgi:hypothetical protein
MKTILAICTGLLLAVWIGGCIEHESYRGHYHDYGPGYYGAYEYGPEFYGVPPERKEREFRGGEEYRGHIEAPHEQYEHRDGGYEEHDEYHH